MSANAAGVAELLTSVNVRCDILVTNVFRNVTDCGTTPTSMSTPLPTICTLVTSPLSKVTSKSASPIPARSGVKLTANCSDSPTARKPLRGATVNGAAVESANRVSRRPVLRTRNDLRATTRHGHAAPKSTRSGKSSAPRAPRARIGTINFSRSVHTTRSHKKSDSLSGEKLMVIVTSMPAATLLPAVLADTAK